MLSGEGAFFFAPIFVEIVEGLEGIVLISRNGLVPIIFLSLAICILSVGSAIFIEAIIFEEL